MMQIEEYLELEAKLSKARDNITKESFVAVFEAVLKHPEVVYVGWAQHTPSFNDGDPCYFTLEESYLVTRSEARAKLDEEGEDYKEADLYEWCAESDDSDWSELGQHEGLSELDGALQVLGTLLDSESLMEKVFGSDAKVRVHWDNAAQEVVWEVDANYYVE